MIEDIRFDEVSIERALKKEHLHPRGIHLNDVRIGFLVQLSPASDIGIVEPVELLPFLFVLGMVGGLIVIEPVVALADLYVGS